METESQEQQILTFLQNGGSLTAYTALTKFHCLRLASRINHLRKQGHDIKTDMVELSNSKRVARYSYID